MRAFPSLSSGLSWKESSPSKDFRAEGAELCCLAAGDASVRFLSNVDGVAFVVSQESPKGELVVHISLGGEQGSDETIMEKERKISKKRSQVWWQN